jgi:predicted ABC-type ATPase
VLIFMEGYTASMVDVVIRRVIQLARVKRRIARGILFKANPTVGRPDS